MYTEKLAEDGVLDIINRNKLICEPFGEIVNEAFLQLRQDIDQLDCEGNQENEDVLDELEHNVNCDDLEEETVSTEHLVTSNTSSHVPQTISHNKIYEKIKTLNSKQRQVSEISYKWVQDHLKSLSCVKKFKVDPIHIFLTRSAGCGKSHLLTTIYHALNKVLSYRCEDLQKKKF